jgi:hypothetical protein
MLLINLPQAIGRGDRNNKGPQQHYTSEFLRSRKQN